MFGFVRKRNKLIKSLTHIRISSVLGLRGTDQSNPGTGRHFTEIFSRGGAEHSRPNHDNIKVLIGVTAMSHDETSVTSVSFHYLLVTETTRHQHWQNRNINTPGWLVYSVKLGDIYLNSDTVTL